MKDPKLLQIRHENLLTPLDRALKPVNRLASDGFCGMFPRSWILRDAFDAQWHVARGDHTVFLALWGASRWAQLLAKEPSLAVDTAVVADDAGSRRRAEMHDVEPDVDNADVDADANMQTEMDVTEGEQQMGNGASTSGDSMNVARRGQNYIATT